MRIAVVAFLGLLAVGARAEGLGERAARTYAVDTSGSTTELAVGERGTLVIAIRCEAGVHLQTQAPLRVKLSASPGLALTRERLGWPDAADRRAESPRFEVAFTATAPGSQEARAHLEFFVCSDAWCVRQEREVALRVAVGGAAAGQAGSRASDPAGTPGAGPADTGGGR